MAERKRLTGQEDPGDLPKDTEENQKRTAPPSRAAVSTARNGNHAIVLRRFALVRQD
jgi:hypothetical protein